MDDFMGGYTSTPEHRTNILPLRWFGNFMNRYASHFVLHMALIHEERADIKMTSLSKRGHMWWRLYHLLDAPYKKWGTVYRLDWHK
jgi:hypothetical protein